MTITRGFAATAMLAGLALGLAGPATAQYQMNGHYVETQSDPSSGQPINLPNGQPLTLDWYFTPCGDGCASVSWTQGGQSAGQAQLANGQWALDTVDNVNCEDGTSVANALGAHRVWDPNTLAGTVQLTYKLPACGNQAGGGWNNNIQLKQAP